MKLSGEDNPFFGQKHTEEIRQKMGENHADVSGSNNPNFGKPLSKERIEKIRGDKNPMFGRRGDKHHCFGRTSRTI